MPRRVGQWALWIAAAAALLWLLAAPLAAALWPLAGDIGALARVWSVPADWAALGGTALLAAAAAVLASLVGLPAACWLGRCRPAGARWLGLAMLAPLLMLPSVLFYGWDLWLFWSSPISRWLGAMGWQQTDRGALRLLCTHVSWLWPLPALLGGLALRSVDADLLRQAALEPGSWRKWLAIRLPVLAPAVAAGGAIAFLLAFGEATVPSLCNLQWHYTNQVMAGFATLDTPPADAAAMALPLGAMAVGLVLSLPHLLRPSDALRFGQDRPAGAAVLRRGWAAPTGTLLAFAVFLGLPLGVLFGQGLPVAALWEGLSRLLDLIGRSLALAAGAATLATALAVPAAAILLRGRAAAWWMGLALTAMLVPGAVVGGQMILLYNRPGPLGWIYDSPLMYVVGMAARYFAVALGVAQMARRAADRNLADAAAADGAGPLGRWLLVELPSTWRVLLAGWLLVTGLSLSAGVELGGALAAPGVTLLSHRLLELYHYRPAEEVIAGSLFSVAVVVALLGATGWLLGRRGRTG